MKKIMLSVVLVLSLVSSLIFVACQRTTKEPSPAQATAVKNPSKKNALVNPYNWLGVFHNQTLLRFAQEPNFGTLGSEQLVDITINYGLQQGVFTQNDVTTLNRNSALSACNIHTPSLQDFKQTADSLFALNLISTDVKNALLLLDSKMKDPAIYNYTNLGDALNHVRLSYAQAEQTLLGNTYNTTDAKLIYSMASTAKHSSAFWHDVVTNPSNPYYDPNLNQIERVRWWEWLIIGAADITGGLVAGCFTANPGAIGFASSAASMLAYLICDAN